MHSQNPELLVHARWILPIAPADSLLENHCIAVNQGRISAILPSAEAATLEAAETVDLGDKLLMPGLVNCHGHAAMSLFRSMADDTALHSWLNDHIWPAEGRWVSDSFVADGVQLAMAEMIRSGTTSFSDMYFFPEVTAREAATAGMRAQLAFPILEFPSAWASGPAEYLSKGLQLRDDFKHSELISVAFGPHAPYTVSNETFEKVAMYAAELDGMRIQVHLQETEQEVQDSLGEHGLRPSQRLNELGILGPNTQCVHLSAINDEDIALLAASGSHGVHCPRSNMKLASGFSPVSKMLDAGINIGLGTDSAASNNSLNVFAEMGFAALLAKGVSGNAAALNAHSALRMATLDGAKVLGLEQEIGSLEVGKQADMIAIDFGDVEQTPLYSHASQLVYTQCGERVSHSWVAGKPLLTDGELQSLDSQRIIAKAQAWASRIQAG